MFTPRGLFKGVACPARENCRLPNCLFDHNAPAITTSPPAATASVSPPADEAKDAGGDRKRRRLDDGSKRAPQRPPPPSRANKPFVGLIAGNAPGGGTADGQRKTPTAD